MQALEKVEKENMKFELVLWGADYSNITSNKTEIINKGYYKQSGLNEVFSSFDVLVVPSIWWETFGYVVLEALSFGLPIICSNMVGASMLLEKSPITIVYEAGNTNELVGVINNIASDEVYCKLIQYTNNIEINNGLDKHTMNILKMYKNKN